MKTIFRRIVLVCAAVAATGVARSMRRNRHERSNPHRKAAMLNNGGRGEPRLSMYDDPGTFGIKRGSMDVPIVKWAEYRHAPADQPRAAGLQSEIDELFGIGLCHIDVRTRAQAC